VSKQYQLIRHREVCERVFETFDKIGTVELRPSLQLTSNGAQMKLTFRFGDRVAIGEKDWLEPTLTIFNSYDLSMNLSLEVGAKRLVCLNGLMAYSRFAGGRHKHVGKVRNLIDSSDVSRQIGGYFAEQPLREVMNKVAHDAGIKWKDREEEELLEDIETHAKEKAVTMEHLTREALRSWLDDGLFTEHFAPIFVSDRLDTWNGNTKKSHKELFAIWYAEFEKSRKYFAELFSARKLKRQEVEMTL
jgi:hypothetical protein